MRFSILDVMVSGIPGLICAGGAAVAYYFTHSFWCFLLGLAASSTLLARLLQYFAPLIPGKFSLESRSSVALRWRVQGFLGLFHVNLLVHTGLVPVTLRTLLYRALGTSVGKSAAMGGKIVDPLLVRLGDHVILGEDSLLMAHSIANQMCTLDWIEIRDRATIGAKAIVLPGVVIEEDAVVAAGAVVLPGTRIGAKETWAGVPARRV